MTMRVECTPTSNGRILKGSGVLNCPRMWNRGVCKFDLNLKQRFYIVKESEMQKGEGIYSRSQSKVDPSVLTPG